MRIVLDECVNPRVEHLLETDHAVSSVLNLGWGGLPDNILVEHLQGRCEVFLTIDHGFEHQHNLSLLEFGIVIVHVPRNRLAYYELIREKIGQAVSSVKPGEVIHVGKDG
ncbi:MAG: DUF5615 family PIN-like protein [Terriglobia bacterium]